MFINNSGMHNYLYKQTLFGPSILGTGKYIQKRKHRFWKQIHLSLLLSILLLLLIYLLIIC